MKTLVTIEFENETGNPSIEDIKLFVNQIIERGFVGPFDIYNHCSMSGISLRVLNSETYKSKLYTRIREKFLGQVQQILQQKWI